MAGRKSSILLAGSIAIYNRRKIIGARTKEYQAAACPKCIVIRKCVEVSESTSIRCHDILHRYAYSKSSFVIPSDESVLVNELPLSYYSLFLSSLKRKLLYKYGSRLQ